MVDAESYSAWTGRLVRLIVVFRTFVLLITIFEMPRREHTIPVMLAVLIAIAVSYAAVRYWHRIAPTVERHPAYLALEVLVATIVLAAAGARSPFFYFTLGTAALAGVLYGRRGAIPFTALLISAYELVAITGLPSLHPHRVGGATVAVPLLYPIALACGIIANEMMQRGAESERALRERTQALSAEQERLRVARELHDSLAKTVEGLAMSASMLPARCEKDPARAARHARVLAEDARQAALEARMLMADLRPQTAADQSLPTALEVRAAAFAERSGVEVDVEVDADSATVERLEPAEVHELLRIVSEALTNAAAHGGARCIRLTIGDDGETMSITVSDDGDGLDAPVDLEALKAAGHFGLAGMDERARSIGGELVVASSAEGGTAVTVKLGGEEPTPAPPASAPRRAWWPRRRTPAGSEPVGDAPLAGEAVRTTIAGDGA